MSNPIADKFRRRRAVRALDELIRLAVEQDDIIQPLSIQNLERVRDKLNMLDNN